MTEHNGKASLSELTLEENVQEVSVPYQGSEYTCPNCEQKIPTRKQLNMSKPAKYSHLLNDIQRCPYCSFVFSYRSKAYVLRQ